MAKVFFISLIKANVSRVCYFKKFFQCVNSEISLTHCTEMSAVLVYQNMFNSQRRLWQAWHSGWFSPFKRYEFVSLVTNTKTIDNNSVVTTKWWYFCMVANHWLHTQYSLFGVHWLHSVCHSSSSSSSSSSFYLLNMTNMTIHEQDRQGYEALTAALETKYKSIYKGIRKYNKITFERTRSLSNALYSSPSKDAYR